jgi:hypothetical protein
MAFLVILVSVCAERLLRTYETPLFLGISSDFIVIASRWVRV